MKCGKHIYSPIAHTHGIAKVGGFDPLDHDIWLPLDEKMMVACDYLVVAKMEGWDTSKGVAFEIELGGAVLSFWLASKLPRETAG